MLSQSVGPRETQQLVRASEAVARADWTGASNELRALLASEVAGTSTPTVASAYLMLATTQESQGLLSDAESSLATALVQYQQQGDSWGQARAMYRLGEIARRQGKLPQAADWFRQSVSISEQTSNGSMLLASLRGLGALQSARGELRAALTTFERASEVNQYVRDGIEASFIARQVNQIKYLFSVSNEVIHAFEIIAEQSIKSGYREGEVVANYGIAAIRVLTGDLEEALLSVEDALPTQNAMGEDISELQSKIDRARSSLKRGEFDSSRGLILSAIQSTRYHLDSPISSSVLPIEVEYRLAEVSALLAVEGESARRYGQVLKRARAEENTSVQIAVLNSLSNRRIANREMNLALGSLQEAVRIAEQASDNTVLVETLLSLGSAYLASQRPQDAAVAYQRALETSQSANNTTEEIESLFGLSSIDRSQADLISARSKLKKALRLARRHALRRQEAVALSNMALLDANNRQYDNAAKKLHAALAICGQLEDREGTTRCLAHLAHVEVDRRHYHRARRYLQRVLSEWLQIGNLREIAETWRDLASVSQYSKQYQEAFSDLSESLRLYQALGDGQLEAVCFFQMGSIFRDMNNIETALLFMAVACWLDDKVKSDYIAVHREHAKSLAKKSQLVSHWNELLQIAETMYGIDKGRGLLAFSP